MTDRQMDFSEFPRAEGSGSKTGHEHKRFAAIARRSRAAGFLALDDLEEGDELRLFLGARMKTPDSFEECDLMRVLDLRVGLPLINHLGVETTVVEDWCNRAEFFLQPTNQLPHDGHLRVVGSQDPFTLERFAGQLFPLSSIVHAYEQRPGSVPVSTVLGPPIQRIELSGHLAL